MNKQDQLAKKSSHGCSQTQEQNCNSGVVAALDERINAKIQARQIKTSNTSLDDSDSTESLTRSVTMEEDSLERFNSMHALEAEEDLLQQYSQNNQSFSDCDESEFAPLTSLATQGRVNEPDAEIGTTGGGYHGYAFDDNLAVAIAVSAEDEEDECIFAAIEYDPDSKPPIYKNRRFRFYVLALICMLVFVGIGSAIGAVKALETFDEAPPTIAPTTAREGSGIYKQLVTLIGEAGLEDRDSPQALAADWIINQDPLQIQSDADNLIQRYIMALFYISTSQISPWKSCNPPTGDETAACNFTKQVDFFPHSRYELVPWTRWLSIEHECEWAGVFCDEFNQTRAIELGGQEMRGTFPSEISSLPYLQSMTFHWNEFYGTLPSELASMKHLLNIEIQYNFFTGQVPEEWLESHNLQRVNVMGNMISGAISTEIGLLSTMKGLFFAENNIDGTIPTEIGQLKYLSFARFGRNFLTGTIPSEIGNLEKLQELWAHRNQLTGQMPSEMGNMRDLGDMRFHYNLISGTIPEEHYLMPQLRRWDVYDMNLGGTISTAIGIMTDLVTYRVRENNLSGTIPTEFGLLTDLEMVWLHVNDLTASVPFELCSLRGPTGIRILDADCAATNGIGPPMIECMLDCCTGCCDSVTGYCQRG